MRKILPIIIISCAIFLGSLFLKVPSSLAANFFFSPSSNTVQQNNNITVTVMLDLQGKRTATAKVALSYDQTKLQFISLNTSNSALSQIISSSGGSGRVSATEYNVGSDGPPPIPPTPATGTFAFMTVTFKALVGAGSTTLSFLTVPVNDSTVYDFDNAGAVLPTTGTSSTYNFTQITAPPPPPPPPPVGVNPPPAPVTVKPPVSGVKSPVPVKPTPAGAINNPPAAASSSIDKGPVISDIRIADSSETSVTIEWKTDKLATSVVYYGSTNSYGLSQGSIDYTIDHKVILPAPGTQKLDPKSTYHFQVASTDKAGSTGVSADQTFVTEIRSSLKQFYRNLGLGLIIGGLAALAIIIFFYFRKKSSQTGLTSGVNNNPPI